MRPPAWAAALWGLLSVNQENNTDSWLVMLDAIQLILAQYYSDFIFKFLTSVSIKLSTTAAVLPHSICVHRAVEVRSYMDTLPNHYRESGPWIALLCQITKFKRWFYRDKLAKSVNPKYIFHYQLHNRYSLRRQIGGFWAPKLSISLKL